MFITELWQYLVKKARLFFDMIFLQATESDLSPKSCLYF